MEDPGVLILILEPEKGVTFKYKKFTGCLKRFD